MEIIDYEEFTLVQEPLRNQILYFIIKSLSRFLIT